MSKIPTLNAVRIIPRESDFLNRKTGSRGEIFFDKESNTLRLYDGASTGGVSLAKADLTNVSNSAFAAKASLAGIGSGGGGNTTVSVGATLPQTPSSGNLWLNTNNGSLYVYINDGDSSQWIQPSYSTPDLENYATKSYVDAKQFELFVAADDSTQRKINTSNLIKFIGGNGITTSSDEDGNITITGSTSIGDVVFDGTTISSQDSSGLTFVPLVNFQTDVIIENDLRTDRIASKDGSTTIFFDSEVSISTNLFVPVIDTLDSSSITIVPATIFNSDVTVENELFGNIVNSEISFSEFSVVGNNLIEKTKTQLDNPSVGTIKTLAMTGGFVQNRGLNPTPADGVRLPMDVNFNGLVTAGDATTAFKIASTTDSVPMRFALQSAWGNSVCGLAFHSPLALDILKYAVGRSDYTGDPTQTNAVILGYQSGPRILVQKTALNSGSEGVDPLNLDDRSIRNDVITMVGSTDVQGVLRVTDSLLAGGTVELRKTAEVIQTITGATGTIDHDTNASALFVHWGMTANFTANFINLLTDDERSYGISLILNQGATPYIANAVEIDGAAQSINWAGGSPPSGTANYVDVINFTLIRTGSSWIVLGSLTAFN